MEAMNSGISRRAFLGGVSAAGALAALGLAGCAQPKSATEKQAVATSSKGAGSAQVSMNVYEIPAWAGTDPDVGTIASTKETDLLIIGAGNGGMAAAAYASDQGVDFIICEKGAEVGATRHWFAAVDTPPFTSQGITVDKARLRGEIARYSSGTCCMPLINMWINESADMFEFVNGIMTASGAQVIADEYEMPGGMGSTSFYTPPFEHHYADANGDRKGIEERNKLFEKHIQQAGHEVSYNHRLVKLLGSAKDGITGAVFETSDGYVQIDARKGVLLTTGGYAANPEMVTALSPITAKSVTALGYNQNNEGEGIQAAVRAGAVKDLTSATMIFDRGLVAPGTEAGYTADSIAAGKPVFPGNGQFNPGTQPFLKMNLRGERFADESADYDYLPHAAAQQPGGVYVSVWDGNFGDDVQRFHTLGCSAGTRMGVLAFKKDDGSYDLDGFFEKYLSDGRLQKADTLEELADKLGYKDEAKKTFLATIARYNELYDAQDDTDFGKEAYRLSAIRQAPFYGATLGGTLLTTIDGIRIDEHCRALDADANPIKGLYCAGDCSGSVFSGNYPDQLHGFACGRTMTEALHVVKEIVAL